MNYVETILNDFLVKKGTTLEKYYKNVGQEEVEKWDKELIEHTILAVAKKVKE